MNSLNIQSIAAALRCRAKVDLAILHHLHVARWHGASIDIYHGLLEVRWKPSVVFERLQIAMRFFNTLATLFSVASLTGYVAADLRIDADHFSFGGVNYPGLQTLNPKEQHKVIRQIVKSGARVIRLFSMTLSVYR